MRSRKKAFYKKRTFIVATALCLLSAFGLAGIYQLESKKDNQDRELVNWEDIDTSRQAENEDPLLEAKEENDLERVDKDTADGQKERLAATASPIPIPDPAVVNEGMPTGQEEQNESEVGQDAESLAETDQVQEETAEASVQNAIALNFKPEDGMIWPVEGNVILDYSMDSSIYFPTLQQYKYNPAIAIQSEAGTPVLSVAAGVIESIVETDETGLTMTIDIGNGYQAVYGQLSNVSLSTGSYVESGSEIAKVAKPSIYYQVEGDNLYFQVLKDGKPVDPLDYIK